MRTLKSQTQYSPWLTYAVLSVLVVGLFLVGLWLGNLIFAPQSQVQSAAGEGAKPSSGAVVNPPFQVHDFTLTNQAGVPMRLKDLHGRAVVVFFGYTHCPDVCPIMLAEFTQVKKLLGAEAERVAFVFVTVDGKRDTPAVLKEFLNHFDPSFIGLTGYENTLRSMAAEYGAHFSSPTDQQSGDGDKDHHQEGIDSENYFVQHTSPAYLIDPKGFLRVVYFNGTAPEIIAQGIRQILEESG